MSTLTLQAELCTPRRTDLEWSAPAPRPCSPDAAAAHGGVAHSAGLPLSPCAGGFKAPLPSPTCDFPAGSGTDRCAPAALQKYSQATLLEAFWHPLDQGKQNWALMGEVPESLGRCCNSYKALQEIPTMRVPTKTRLANLWQWQDHRSWVMGMHCTTITQLCSPRALCFAPTATEIEE